MNERKHWWESKTLWFNIATGLVTFAVEFSPLQDLITDPDVKANAALILLTASTVGNFLLRLITRDGLK